MRSSFILIVVEPSSVSFFQALLGVLPCEAMEAKDDTAGKIVQSVIEDDIVINELENHPGKDAVENKLCTFWEKEPEGAQRSLTPRTHTEESKTI